MKKKRINIDTLDYTQTKSYLHCVQTAIDIERKINTIKTSALEILGKMETKPTKKEIKKSIHKQVDKVFDEETPFYLESLSKAIEEMFDYNEGYSVEYYTNQKIVTGFDENGKEITEDIEKEVKVELAKRQRIIKKEMVQEIAKMKRTTKNGIVKQINFVLSSDVSDKAKEIKERKNDNISTKKKK